MPMNSNWVNKQRFWYLLERKTSGNATGSELAELDKIIMRSPEAGNTALLIERLWQCHSADEIERAIRHELAEGHEAQYLWPEKHPKTTKTEQPLPVFDRLTVAYNSQAINNRKIDFDY
jgi:hypothetical protein